MRAMKATNTDTTTGNTSPLEKSAEDYIERVSKVNSVLSSH